MLRACAQHRVLPPLPPVHCHGGMWWRAEVARRCCCGGWWLLVCRRCGTGQWSPMRCTASVRHVPHHAGALVRCYARVYVRGWVTGCRGGHGSGVVAVAVLVARARRHDIMRDCAASGVGPGLRGIGGHRVHGRGARSGIVVVSHCDCGRWRCDSDGYGGGNWSSRLGRRDNESGKARRC